MLKEKGIDRKGKLEFIQKNKDKKVMIVELNVEIEKELLNKIEEVKKLIQSHEVPNVVVNKHCKKCAYYDYCFI